MIDPLGAYLVGVAAVALAVPVLVAAVVERPPAAVMPRTVIAIATACTLMLASASIAAAFSRAGLALLGVLVATDELAAAAVIWTARGRSRGGGDDGGWADRDEPPGASGDRLPDEYWQRWEEQFASAARR